MRGRTAARFDGNEEGEKLCEMSEGKRGDCWGLEGDGKGQKEKKSGVSPGATNAREEKKGEKKKSESELEERKLPEKHDKDCEPGIDNESVV